MAYIVMAYSYGLYESEGKPVRSRVCDRPSVRSRVRACVSACVFVSLHACLHGTMHVRMSARMHAPAHTCMRARVSAGERGLTDKPVGRRR